jgi:hypothetical protein
MLELEKVIGGIMRANRNTGYLCVTWGRLDDVTHSNDVMLIFTSHTFLVIDTHSNLSDS